MKDEYRIHLNFLPVRDELDDFVVHRKLRTSAQEPRPNPDIMAYRLPAINASADWSSYWISIDPLDGFDPIDIGSTVNPDLTCRVLFWSLVAATQRVLEPKQFHIPESSFIEEVSFIQRTHAEGDERLEVQPYYLRADRRFGYLTDFHFRLRDGVPFSRKVQQLSLSLDKSFRRNLDYYVDRSSKVRTFVDERHDVLGSLRLPGTGHPIPLGNDLVALPADRLRSKTYVFVGNREARSQFSGLRDHGPLRPLESCPSLLFIFREQDRSAARRLAQGLRGGQQRGRFSFPGFHALFKVDLDIDSNPVVLTDLGKTAMETALKRVQRERQDNPNTVPVLLPTDDDAYLVHKALFTAAGIPTQVCTLRILQDEDTLKWAIANLALQIFCKARGYPWKVQPTNADRSLIIGISQSHKTRTVGQQRSIEKYFAFSVMTDNSGLFQKIQVLSESNDEPDYLTQLQRKLSTLLTESAEAFSRVVVHTSFKLKHREIDAIHKTIEEAANSPQFTCRFAVVKVNHKSRFFGINRRANSLVPYEATRVKLGPREYLVWFEGIFPDRPTVTKAFPGPTHLQILRVSDEHGIPDDILLRHGIHDLLRSPALTSRK